MHTFNEMGTGVPAFLAKLWRLVDDPETNNLITWSKDGRSFVIQNQAQFARDLLPMNYKHNNMASFIRQLNMYGFHKITSIDNGGLKFDRDEMEFSHPCFKRNCPFLLEHIKRKIANTKSFDEKSNVKPEAVSKVLQDVKAMRGRQDSLDSRFSVMKQENEALWREIASLRQKHAKQQQIVNKLIQFLITIVQPSRNMTSVKRHMQLMINDTPDNDKLRKTSESETNNGPVIHELGEELLDEITEHEVDIIDPNSPYDGSVHTLQLDNDSYSPHSVDRPHSSISLISQNCDNSNQSAEDALNVGAITVSANNDDCGQSIIQSVNADGSEIVYHVTEVSDSHPTEIMNPQPRNYSEESVLTTPMVREQIARSQLLKQKNKERHSRTGNTEGTCLIVLPKQQRYSQQQKQQIVSAPSANQNELQIKKEHEIDPNIYLNTYSDSSVITADPDIISQNFIESRRLNSNDITSVNFISKAGQRVSSVRNEQSEDLYNPTDLADSEVPSDIFEDSSFIDGEHNFIDSFKENAQTQKLHTVVNEQPNVIGRNSAINGKVLSTQLVSPDNNNMIAGASTSAAAAVASVSDFTGAVFNTDVAADSLPKQDNRSGEGLQNLAVAKYSRNANDCNDVDVGVKRDEVNGHLENMQDELESLKDLLRSDGYSLDANTLLGLFNDTDILGPYGLTMPADTSADKKGSEIMSYQPIYDLSDIININDESELDDANPISDSTTTSCHPQSSALNTPHHE